MSRFVGLRMSQQLWARIAKEARRRRVAPSEVIRSAVGRELKCEKLAEMPPPHRPKKES